MPTKLIFLTWILAHFAARFLCGGCGVADACRIFHYPAITRRGNRVVLRFPVRCACGKTGSLRVELPVLLFGYLLAWQVIFEADKRGRTSVAAVPVIGHESKLFPRIVCEYVDLIGSLPLGATSGPSAADQVLFELDDEGWAKFLKKLGFDGDAPAES